MSNLSIKVTIANRVYPLTIDVEEEEVVRKAAKEINEKVKDFAKTFSVKDKQDLLRMAVLQYAVETKKVEGKSFIDDSEVASKLLDLDAAMSDYLSNQ